MNAFGQQPCDETTGGLDPFASSRLEIGNVGRHGTFGVFLAPGAEVNSRRFPHYIFQGVEREGAIAVDRAALGQIEVEARQGRDNGIPYLRPSHREARLDLPSSSTYLLPAWFRSR